MTRGFTLVELLVVITVIALLLALLAPALDRAIYQAELAVCGAKVHAIAVGFIEYAARSKRHYPHREAIATAPPNVSWQPHRLYNGGGTPATGRNIDDRPVLQAIFPINRLLNCPLNGSVDIEGSSAQSWIYGSYALWFGWQWRGELAAMRRLGDRFTWQNAQFSVLAGDNQTLRPGYNNCTHPDRNGLLHNVKLQDEYAQTSDIAVGTSTVSWWQGADRSLVDLNYAYDDGSVVRHSDLRSTPQPPLESVPAHYDPAQAERWPTKYTMLPRR